MQFIRNSFYNKSLENPLFDNFSADVLENILTFHKTVPATAKHHCVI